MSGSRANRSSIAGSHQKLKRTTILGLLGDGMSCLRCWMWHEACFPSFSRKSSSGRISASVLMPSSPMLRLISVERRSMAWSTPASPPIAAA